MSSKFTALTYPGTLCFGANCLAVNSLLSSLNSLTAWWVWRHVRALITGRGSLSGLVTKCD